MAAEADTLVIFGITGDLAQKMTFQALYQLERRGELDCRGHRRRPRRLGPRTSSTATPARRSRPTVDDPDEEVLKRLEERLSYVQGDYDEPTPTSELAEEIGGHEQAVFYLEIPPSLFAMVVEQPGRGRADREARGS